MPKVLLSGAALGRWAPLLERARKLNASAKGGGFELLLVVGGALPFPSELLRGDAAVPLPVYVLIGDEPPRDQLEDEAQRELLDRIQQATSGPVEIAPNCFVLAGKGVTTINGLTIAYLSGVRAADGDDAAGPFRYSDDDVAALASEIVEAGKESEIDFLLTAELPSGFQELLPEQQLPAELQQSQGSSSVAKMLEVVLPKYHITTADVFYQRLPYVSDHAASGRKQLTRLISLASVNTTKDKTKKYLHALQVTPTSANSDSSAQVDIPAGTTQNPYIHASQEQRNRENERALKRQRIDGSNRGGLSVEQVAELTQKGARSGQFFYDQRLAERGQRRGNLIPGQGGHDRRGNNRPLVPERTECWFCLATPSLERHLIVSIGEEAYLAMPKGAISVDHVLIVPIAHEMSTMKLSDATWKEMDRFKEALRKYFASQGKELLVFDRNTTTIGATHCHLQCVGVPKDLAANARRVFEVEGEKYRVKFEELSSDDDLKEKTDGRPFFYAELPDGQDGTSRLLNIVEDKHYVQFGRHAAACVLGMPRRSNWKFCVVPKDEEESLTNEFKKAWQPFDFTVVDEDE